MPASLLDRLRISTAELFHAEAIAAIYDYYARETVVTFEEAGVPALEVRKRIEGVQAMSLPWLVAEHDGNIMGYAYAKPWKDRSAYRFAVEISVYTARNCERRGIGTKLYGQLFPLLQERGIHAVMGGIVLPNEASVSLHERFGMTKVAHFREVGFKFDRWLDVGYWQRIF